MKKTVWIWNHYATSMYKDRAGRHYSFAQNLRKRGYNPVIFCASTNHFSNENIKIEKNNYRVDVIDEIPSYNVKPQIVDF